MMQKKYWRIQGSPDQSSVGIKITKFQVEVSDDNFDSLLKSKEAKLYYILSEEKAKRGMQAVIILWKMKSLLSRDSFSGTSAETRRKQNDLP